MNILRKRLQDNLINCHSNNEYEVEKFNLILNKYFMNDEGYLTSLLQQKVLY